MPDCYGTRLMFGGTISRSDFEVVLDALNTDGLFDYQRDDIREAAHAGEIIEVADAERPWGDFEATEACLIRLGIPFQKLVEGKYACDAEVTVFDGNERRQGSASADFEPVVTVTELRAALEAGTVPELLARLDALDLQITPVLLTGPPSGENAAAAEAA